MRACSRTARAFGGRTIIRRTAARIRRWRPSRPSYGLDTLKRDAFGGGVAAVMMVPEALGFGVLSGLGPVSAFYGAIVLSFVVAVLGGAAPMISGPSAIVTIFTAVIVSAHADNITEVFTIVVLSGLFQIAFGALRLGRLVNWVPFAVVRGVFAGVGGYIMAVQTLPALGAEIEPGMGLVEVIIELPDAIAHFHTDTLVVALIALLIFVFWPERLHRILPNALIALVLSTLASILIFHSAPQHAEAHVGLPEFHIPPISTDILVHSVQPALILAFVGSIYSLLTAQVIDPITGRNHRPNRELMGLGVGNFIVGFIGGMPGAASVPCSFLAARAGSLTAMTGVICSAIMLAALLGLGDLIAWIPHAAFAGIFIAIGWEMMDFRFLRRLPNLPPHIALVTAITAALTIFVDLITAIEIGFIVAVLATAVRGQRQEVEQTVSTPILDSEIFPEQQDDPHADPFRARVGLLSLRGHYSLASAREVVRVLTPDLAEHEAVIFDFSQTTSIDDSAVMAIEELIENAVIGQDKGCVVVGVSGDVKLSLDSHGILDDIPEENLVDDLEAARIAARRFLER